MIEFGSIMQSHDNFSTRLTRLSEHEPSRADFLFPASQLFKEALTTNPWRLKLSLVLERAKDSALVTGPFSLECGQFRGPLCQPGGIRC